MAEPEQPPLTPLEALQKLQDGFDNSPFEACQILVDMLKRFISTEMSDRGDALPLESIIDFNLKLADVGTNVRAMQHYLAELKKRVKA